MKKLLMLLCMLNALMACSNDDNNDIPDYGAPYQMVVPALFDSDNFVTRIVDDYYAQKNGPEKNLDQPLTVIKMSEMEPPSSYGKRQEGDALCHLSGKHQEAVLVLCRLAIIYYQTII